MSNRTTSHRPRKEAYFVQIENADKTPMFVNVSNQLGKPLNVSKPLATTMMQVRDDSISFSVLKMYKAALARLTAEPLALKPGPLARLDREVKKLEEPLSPTQLQVTIDDQVHMLEMKRDENGVVTLDYPGDAAEATLELPRSPLKITMFLSSPRTNRMVAVGWQGYQGKPGDPETVVRAAAQALNHIAGLAEFRILANITNVKVPPAPGRYQVITPTRKAADKVLFDVPVRLWNDDAASGPVGAGAVKVEVDLDTANPATSQLLFHFTPEAEIAEAFTPYRSVLDRALSSAFADFFGPEELNELACDIALSEIDEGGLGRLRDAAATVVGYELNPSKWMPPMG